MKKVINVIKKRFVFTPFSQGSLYDSLSKYIWSTPSLRSVVEGIITIGSCTAGLIQYGGSEGTPTHTGTPIQAYLSYTFVHGEDPESCDSLVKIRQRRGGWDVEDSIMSLLCAPDMGSRLVSLFCLFLRTEVYWCTPSVAVVGSVSGGLLRYENLGSLTTLTISPSWQMGLSDERCTIYLD